jgi:Fur family zinc uptake transcriptional regulator
VTSAAILARLRTAGCRLTASRRALIEALLAAEKPLTAEALHARTGAAGLNLSTVYRNLSTFCELGWLEAVPGLNGERFYRVRSEREASVSVLCLDCGSLNMLQTAPPAPDLRAAVRDLGFRTEALSVTIAAHCEQRCARRAAG